LYPHLVLDIWIMGRVGIWDVNEGRENKYRN